MALFILSTKYFLLSTKFSLFLKNKGLLYSDKSKLLAQAELLVLKTFVGCQIYKVSKNHQSLSFVRSRVTFLDLL